MATKKVFKLSKWKPKKDQVLAEQNGKLFDFHFEKISDIKDKEKAKLFDSFMLNKESYENQLPIITKYDNYFFNFHDTDKEVAMAYYDIKVKMDKRIPFVTEEDGPFPKMSVIIGRFIDYVYDTLFTKTLIKKIEDFTEDNYLDDIEGSDDYYKKSEKKHLESLEFTNEHNKILLEISMGMKLLAPIMLHFAAINSIRIGKDSDYIFRFYEPLFRVFGKGVNMYNKLFVYVKAKVYDCHATNGKIFDQREIQGVDILTVIRHFIQKVIISENMIKYRFNETWDSKNHKYKENVIGFNKVVMQYQLRYFVKESYAVTYIEVSDTKNTDGLSGSDKMAMNLNKLDEGVFILIDLNVNHGLKKIMESIDVDVTKEEIEYYMENYHPVDIQTEMIRYHFAKYVDSVRDLKVLDNVGFITLAIILKKKLLIEAGYDAALNGEEYKGSVLPYILTGNVIGHVNNRMIRNNKSLEKIKEDPSYQYLVNEKYKYLEEINDNHGVLSIISTFSNTKFSYVTPENPDLTGKEIDYPEDKLQQELLFMMKRF